MDVERAREMLLALPHVVETMQWGDNLVFWVGDKAVGGKMFALVNLDRSSELVISFAAGPERSTELCEMEGFRPAPYFARLHWVAAERWDALSPRQWQTQFSSAHSIVFDKLPPRTRATLELPAARLGSLVAERRRVLASAEPKKRKGKTTSVKRSATGDQPI